MLDEVMHLVGRQRRMSLSWDDMQRSSALAREASDECLKLGRCVFSSEEAFLQQLDCSDRVDDVVLHVWRQHRAMVPVGTSLAGLVTPPAPAARAPVASDSTSGTSTSVEEGCASTAAPASSSVSPEAQASWSKALAQAGVRFVVAPARWSVSTALSWAAWAASSVPATTARGLSNWWTWRSASTSAAATNEQQHAAPADGGPDASPTPIISASSMAEESQATTVSQRLLSRGRTPPDRRSHAPKGIIFLPALHMLSLKVMESLSLMGPYHHVYTVDAWEDFILESMGIRNGDEVTEFMVANGFVRWLELPSQMPRIVQPPAGKSPLPVSLLWYVPETLGPEEVAKELREAQRVGQWKLLLYLVDDVVTRWESELCDTASLAEPPTSVVEEHGETGQQVPVDSDEAANPSPSVNHRIQWLREKLQAYKLIHVQMVKCNDDVESQASSLTLEGAANQWEEMMSNFPQVWELLRDAGFHIREAS